MYLGFSLHLLIPLFFFNHTGYSLMKNKKRISTTKEGLPHKAEHTAEVKSIIIRMNATFQGYYLLIPLIVKC